jgi:Tfp pilus assembly protein FimT
MNTIARRKAHTLIELLAVVAILVVVVGIGLPLIKPMLHQRDDDAAADLIRARLSKLQSKAVRDGKTYCFEYHKNTGEFRLASDEDEGIEEEDHFQETGILPGEIKFDDANHPSKNGWIKVASFMPDNTAKQYVTLKIGKDEIVLHGATKAEAK